GWVPPPGPGCLTGTSRPAQLLGESWRLRGNQKGPPTMQALGGMTRQNVTDAWCEALFASGLQRSDAPTAGMVAEAIQRAMRQFGIRGCVSRMAQEFGDHPDAAAERMRWIRQLAAEVPPLGRRS